MPQLTIIVGMGGSGKSELCKKIAESSMPRPVIFSDATLTYTDERRAGHGCLGEMVARLLGQSEDCVMDESHLIDPCFRGHFRNFCGEFLPQVELHWIFFEADVLACINNTYADAQLNVRRELSRYKALDNQRKVYVVPNEQEWPGRKVHPVYKCNKPAFSTEPEAICWLHSEIEMLSTT